MYEERRGGGRRWVVLYLKMSPLGSCKAEPVCRIGSSVVRLANHVGAQQS